MKRLFLLLSLCLLSLSAFSQDYQYEIMKLKDGELVYLTQNKKWVSKKEWIYIYGKPMFNSVYNGMKPTHQEHATYIRTHIAKSITHLGNQRIVWSRVIEDDRPISELIQLASAILPNATVDGNVVSGTYEECYFKSPGASINATLSYLYGMGDVKYEFREGRYKITVSNIVWRNSASLSIFVGHANVKQEVVRRPIYELLYSDQGELYSESRWYNVANDLDFTYCEMFIIDHTEETNHHADEW